MKLLNSKVKLITQEDNGFEHSKCFLLVTTFILTFSNYWQLLSTSSLQSIVCTRLINHQTTELFTLAWTTLQLYHELNTLVVQHEPMSVFSHTFCLHLSHLHRQNTLHSLTLSCYGSVKHGIRRIISTKSTIRNQD